MNNYLAAQATLYSKAAPLWLIETLRFYAGPGHPKLRRERAARALAELGCELDT